jgi:cyclic-di-GMP phosphodiesterase, flagellum assembly factor TipF
LLIRLNFTDDLGAGAPMATIADKVRISHHVKAGSFAAALALSAAAGSALAPLAASVAIPILAIIGLAACGGFVAAWRRAEAALRLSEQAAAQCALLADRLISLERQSQAPAASPALRTTVAEVTGTVGLLGGVVRELAKNMAAQHRDVADLKDSLRLPPRTREAHRDERPALKIVPEPRRIRDQQEPSCSAPEPSLLPSARRSTDEELRRMRLIAQALEADGIELHLQPIVALPQCKVRFYEAFARLRLMNGTLLDPCEFLPLIERLGLAPDFDRRILERAMAVARHLVARRSEAIVGVNLSACSVDEPGFLRSLAGLLDASPDILGRIVLELPQTNWRRLDPGQRAALAALRDRGVPLSLHRACDVGFDASALAEARALASLGLRFMKLPADAMLAAATPDDAQAGLESGVRDFASALRREGIRLVAERVECEEAVPALISLGVPLAQGFVFAAPRAVRAEVFEQGTALPDEETSFDPSLLRCAG